MKNIVRPLFLLLLTALLSSCGYTNARTCNISGPAGGGCKATVMMFTNDTYEPLVEEDVTSALKNELALDGRWTLTDRQDADFAVTGRVSTFDLQPLSYDARERIQEYRVRLKVEVKVSDIKAGKVVWKDSGIETYSEYRVTRDITKGKIGRNEAVKKASKDFAEEFVIRALDTF